MKKLWFAVLAVLMVTPLFALNSEEESNEYLNAQKMAVTKGAVLLLEEVTKKDKELPAEEFPSAPLPMNEIKLCKDNAEAFLSNPKKFHLNEVAGLMLKLWLVQESQNRWGVRDNPMLRMELLKEMFEDGVEVKNIEQEISEKANWYYKEIQNMDMDEKLEIILKKLKELRAKQTSGRVML